MTISGAAAGGRYPKISIVTPSLNQGRYLDAAIRSVLEQGYPDLEYIVIDGGSGDESRGIIERYSDRLAFWQSEPDRGQADAIAKGFARASGEIFAWLNADDTYENGVLLRVAELFARHAQTDIISGRCRLWYGDGRDRLMAPSPLRSYQDFLRVGSNWLNERLILQPEAFFRSEAYRSVSGLRTDLTHAFDVDLWIRFARAGCRFEIVDEHWANLRMHPDQKTADPDVGYAQLCLVAWQHLQKDWGRLDEETRSIADDVFCALAKVQQRDRQKYESIRHSTSYRLGRLITRLKCW